MYELQHIKVPEGLVKKAREQGTYRSIIFWFKIKPIYQTGYFLRKDFIKVIKQFYNISESNIRLHLNKLIKLGFIKVSPLYYQLISYDKLYTHFGYDLRVSRNKQRIRKGNFAIDKIAVDDIDSLEDRIDCGELKLNLQRQVFYVKKVFLDKKAMSNVLDYSIKIKDDQHSTLIFDGSNIAISKKSLLKVKDQLSATKNQQKINTILGISCKKICQILGYKSTKSVHDFKHRSVNSGLLHIQQQKVVFKKYCNMLDEILLKRKLRPITLCFKGSFGKELSYQLCDNFLFNF